MQSICRKIVLLILFSLLMGTLSVASADTIKDEIVLGGDQVAIENAVVTKRPDIICQCKDIDVSSISMVMLDDTDITANIKHTKNGFAYKSVLILPAGEHTLSIFYIKQGEDAQKDYTFITRQSKMFERAQSDVGISANYENIVKKSKNLTGVIWSKAQADIGLKTSLGEKRWNYSFETDLRFLDQSLAVQPPEIKGINLASYLFSVDFNGDNLQAGLKLGDVTADESDYSVQGLASRGVAFSAIYQKYELHTFLMDGVQNYGWHGGMGLSARDSDHIYGVSLQRTFLEDTKLKVIYAKGGRVGDGFGTSSEDSSSVARKGDVLGFLFNTSLIQEKLNLTSEIDFSKFDQDSSDGFGYERDKAYNVKFDGSLNEKYSYNLMYEYLGPKYNSIAADGLEKDKSGFSGELDANFNDIHALTFGFSRYNDNVKNDSTYARVYTTEESLNYTYLKFENIPMSAGWNHSVQKSEHEPSSSDIVETLTDTINTQIGYNVNNWNYGLSVEYTKTNDKSTADADTTSKTVSFTPAYSIETFHLEASFTFNRSTSKQDVDTDTFTVSLGLGGTFFSERVGYDFSSSYEKNRPDVGDDTYTLSINGQIAYNFVAPKRWMDHPIVGIKGVYNNGNADSTTSTENTTGESYSVSLFVSIPLNYSF
ncbi:MAG: hypothetical protein QM482_02410 [Sulfurospirillum sp.]